MRSLADWLCLQTVSVAIQCSTAACFAHTLSAGQASPCQHGAHLPVWYEQGEGVWEVERIMERKLVTPAHWVKRNGKDRWLKPEFLYRFCRMR